MSYILHATKIPSQRERITDPQRPTFLAGSNALGGGCGAGPDEEAHDPDMVDCLKRAEALEPVQVLGAARRGDSGESA